MISREARFLVATILTIVVVSFIVVPWVSAILEGLATYAPGAYEPKDFKRGELQRRLTDPGTWTVEHLLNLGLVVLLVVVWFITASDGRPGSRSR